MLNNLKGKNIILASNSPRRHELLKGLDLDFTVLTRPVDEIYPDDLALEDIPEFLAVKKANAYQDLIDENTIVITSDTVVINEDEVLEKPQDAGDAARMLKAMSGKQHLVVTGVCILTAEKIHHFADHTKVKFTTLNDSEIDYYVAKYKPYDKAGAYGVQEWIGYVGIERLNGSYYTVMGLPVHKLYKALKELN
ncbi:Maf family nucleotide pyrophosphatase [Crocinitomix algicola]|uniref:Maf family nucleotide pyrophosphatase n=1 Tax=Crocinitomix algicola TaxID=1740263 RepID=UPI0008358436|nr:Maf family nucleotide pyrophosphatase [Crocinitomix algicola]